MEDKTFKEHLKVIPVPLLPALVGAATLSNVYSGLGFSAVRHITMWGAAALLILYFLKIVNHPKICLAEYSTPVPASLYAGLTMLMMILGSYFFEFSPALGKGLWFFGLGVHTLHILVFTWQKVLKERAAETFVPSWFVTYNGIMVSCVVGGAMGVNHLLIYVVYYGITIYFILLPLLVYRLLTKALNPPLFHTLAIFLAPCSLCLVSYLNIIPEPDKTLVLVLYGCVVCSLTFVLLKLPKFLSFPFHPGFAGLTFPMAIGIVASTKMAAYLEGQQMSAVSGMVKQLSGIQIYLTTAIISFVLFHLLKMLRKN